MRDSFEKDKARFERYHLVLDDLLFDYSRNRINEETIPLLCQFANEMGLDRKLRQLFNGDKINISENRAVLHTALRNAQAPIFTDGKDVSVDINETQKKLTNFANQIHRKTWLGATSKPIKHIVNIGIGGSHLGPRACVQALKDYAINDLSFHFVSTVDKTNLLDVWNKIDPETSLFIISSKSFTTIETMTNAETLRSLMQEALGESACSKHFIAITASVSKALAFGIAPECIFPIWEWVGGRYSVWSSIGFVLLLLIGEEQFEAFLSGARIVDQHFLSAPFHRNIPVVLALLSLWYLNFFGAQAQAIIAYSHLLRHFVPYLQQIDMESNGKSVSMEGETISYNTGPIIFGGEGCNGQHAYHQLLHQGRHFIPVDFILIDSSEERVLLKRHENLLIASALSQATSLLKGKTYEESYLALLDKKIEQSIAKQVAHHQVIPGNKPSNILYLKQLTPKNLGMLIAIYEHKVFVQGALWNINSFDQWGVEQGKQLLPTLLDAMMNVETSAIDPNTLAFLKYIREKSKT